ncbi:cytochrome bc complex cytochrome b subunit [Venenivibrio stagnispumantis]|uniref:Cytochrome b n=1 Tax=Venenivibrio stagnispumantis TaxID=407998 RepID=A0AA45WL32_9AQUI|nr:cytochrome bc complex cytochrome b subunit [Venenivibrio stagnispumantis]MCW4573677.1 cytochrome bc complex cytochrome b subunit [Venenivibrio stagnispumantis]SMP09912.1 ubiquinol-cytochrome c reductase cytochrome b subunit [Venenivibrio stagnispumantis]
MGKFIDWLDERLAIKELIKVMLTEYYVPKNINFLWSFGVLLMLVMAILFVSGIFLLMYYKPDAHLAFDSVNKTIMMDVEYGWLFRHTHAVGASIMFLVLYIHMARGIYYGSFKKPREIVWITGYILFVLMAATAFTGYLLPWGQMSYWAAQTITTLFEKIPFIGPDLVIWIRGNYIVEDATLTRFFALHVMLLPLLLIIFTAIHLYAVRIAGSNNEDGIELTKEEKKKGKGIPFWPVFMAKEFFVMSVFLIFFFYLVFYNYKFAMDPINFTPADYLQTPMHIYPEWYFLAFYEVLRGFFFSQNLGLIAFVLSMFIAAFLPWLDKSPIVSGKHRPLYKIAFWIFIADFVFLTILGKLPPTGLYAWLGFIGSLIYFAFFISLPIISKIEKRKQNGGIE